MVKEKHIGLSKHRIVDNKLERRFAMKWQDLNDESRILNYLLSDSNEADPTSARERAVAATVIQWLGSPIGQVFIHDVLGYRIKL